MPALIAAAAINASGVAAASAAAAAITAVSYASVTVASPAAPLVIGADRWAAPQPAHRPPAPELIPADDCGRRVVLASAIGLRCAIEYGPRAYVAPVGGACLAPELRDGMLVLVDPDATPQVGDVVVIYTRDRRSLAFADRRGPQWLLEDDDLANPDAEIAEVLCTHRVAQAGAWAYAKRLARPLPPRDAWAQDTDFSLVVEITNPHVELRAHLSPVTAIDKVLGVLDFSSCSPTIA